MKSGVLIALIVCGMLLLAGPSLMDHFRDPDEMMLSDSGRMTFLLGGGLMILGAIVGALVSAFRPGPRT